MLRRENCSEFYIVGVEYEKDMQPVALLMLGTSNKFDYLKEYWGVCMGTVTQKGKIVAYFGEFYG